MELNKSLVLILLLALQSCGGGQPPRNVVHITADDLGYGDLGSFGQELIKTPHLDQLAAEGMRFTQHYAGSALCSPSRYAFFTGKHAGSTGAVAMRRAGYYTGMIGKWALGPVNSSGAPLKQGFDYFFGYADQVTAHNYYPVRLIENYWPVGLPGNILSEQRNIAAEKKTYAAESIQRRAITFLQDNRDKPFYLQLDYNLPHVNNELHALTGNGFEHPGPGRYADKGWTEAEKSYAEMVSLIDDYVGELIAKLHSLGLAKNTLVIFTSDNGPTGVRTRGSLQRFNATGGLRGIKGTLFEGGIRVPMIAWWPGTIKRHSVNNSVTTFWDVMPTLAELIGSEEILETDGESFAGTLRSWGWGWGKDPGERLLYWEIDDRKAVRHGDWKWVHHPMKVWGDFLYNIAQDPGETANLATKSPEILARLQSMPRPGASGSPRELDSGTPPAANPHPDTSR
jgi:arylsulfatase A-like enzyme